MIVPYLIITLPNIAGELTDFVGNMCDKEIAIASFAALPVLIALKNIASRQKKTIDYPLQSYDFIIVGGAEMSSKHVKKFILCLWSYRRISGMCFSLSSK